MQQSLEQIPGLGEKTLEALHRLGIDNFYDLLFHFPTNITHKRVNPPLYSLTQGELIVAKVTIIDIAQPNNPNASKRRPFSIFCSNDTGQLQLCYFSYYPQYLMNWAKIGSEIIVIGKVDTSFNGLKQIAHPEVLKPNASYKKDEVIYPLTYGIINKQLQKYIQFALDQIKNIPEWKQYNSEWPNFQTALHQIHNPERMEQISPYDIARQRIAADELLATQLMVNLLRNSRNVNTGRSINPSGNLLKDFLASLPFELTSGQQQAIKDITEDQNNTQRMSRLLQGDVGSGKTIVAFAAMFNVVESGAQTVLMAPTDVLANQHFLTLQKFCSHLPIKYALLTGKTRAKERKLIMEQLQTGELQILVGTHAVFQDKVIFKDLALVVIDEQHRFGVEQRLSLVNKGNEADLLIMSATPIPRSLSLTLYGDMDITKITEKPKSRIPIKTAIIPKTKLNEVVHSLENILKNQGKIYWVCPLITKSEEIDLDMISAKTAAETRFQELSKHYPAMVGLIHGQLDNHTKQTTLDKFIQGDHRILVATTVIEVGVDVPDATVIIIENAESFGLSQLHQLRGRVGRGDQASHCILLYNPPISATSWQRLKILRDTEDGFLLAEEDLKLRGSGDIIGTKQSGLPSFKTVDFIAHHHLISEANKQAKEILKNDPFLKHPDNQKYHDLLRIFGFHYKKLELK